MKWTLEYHTSPLGETGDYSSEAWITDGYFRLYCYDEKIDNDELQELCDKLNSKSQIVQLQGEIEYLTIEALGKDTRISELEKQVEDLNYRLNQYRFPNYPMGMK